ncbi:hypothetical protein L6164_031073 [Bauhinia variegata]|uniref:Uncharacterized protein n=1 Tax=Bauhinia variegata TaxID=167791 RepID=A0ACB9LFL2_BAUVA|nr:hypothetical protein L6164_031073 [Bauhinia variegata]
MAASVYGDRSAFYDCTFQGVQDTLWDVNGRHYFHKCNIQGQVDFIWGNGQSIYELILISNVYEALGCVDLRATTIAVSQSGRPGTFKTIQSAIDSVPSKNNRWVRVLIPAGVYREKVQIPIDKPCIFLQGAGSKSTIIEWGDFANATLTASASDFGAKTITFRNTYNLPPTSAEDEIKYGLERRPANAASVYGDRSAFFNCIFQGVQDTLWDADGRHFFHKCNIQGEVDFIWGNGQSIYEQCVNQYVENSHGFTSYITAQGREFMTETSGFVFKECKITGNGKAYLGRAYRAFSRVIIANSVLTNVVYPVGWYAWDHVGHEANLTYVEEGNTG